MGMGVDITSAFGWVIDKHEGSISEDLWAKLSDEQREDLATVVAKQLEDEQVDAETVTFGYDYSGIALVAKGSVTTTHNWVHDMHSHQRDERREPAFTRELDMAVKELGWEGAELGDPQWLLLVSYG